MFINDEHELNNPALFYGVTALLVYSSHNNLEKPHPGQPNTPSSFKQDVSRIHHLTDTCNKHLACFIRGKNRANACNLTKKRIMKEKGVRAGN
jgi:hypothetical protein